MIKRLLPLLALMVVASTAHADASVVAGRYRGLLDLPGSPAFVELELRQVGDGWTGTMVPVEASTRGEAPRPVAIAATPGRIAVTVPDGNGSATCTARVDGDRLRSEPGQAACGLDLVRVSATGLAAKWAGAWQDGQGRTYAIASLPDFPQMTWIDYQTGDWRYLFERDDRLEAGAGMATPNPVAITLRATADGGLQVHRSGDAKPQRLTRQQFVERPLAWSNGAATLHGTLILPPGAGPFPAIVLTQMSSPAPRDAYRTVAYFFAAHGIASLIYDRRGLGESSGDEQSAGLHDLADDAIAGVHRLQEQPEIDPRRIGAWGHSQGGWVAPIAAARSSDVSFVIAQSAPAITPAAQEIFRVGTNARNAGLSEAEIAAAIDYERLLMHWVRTGEGREAIHALAKANTNARWARFVELREDLPAKPSARSESFWHFDPLPDLRRVHVPVLAIYGDRDGYVPVAESSALLRAALKQGGAQARIEILPDAAHGLWAGNTESFHAGALSPGMHPRYWPTLLQWLREQQLARAEDGVNR